MNTAVARENWVGQTVDGKFPLLKWLGGSERCDVFRTQLPGQPPQTAVIKLVSPKPGNAARQVSRWQSAAGLVHPHLLRIFQAGQCQISGTPLLYIVMECAEEDLSQVLPARALTPEEAREMLLPLLDALSYLHGKGLVHGRIKPSNIMAVGDQLRLSSDSIQPVNEIPDLPLSPSAFNAPEVAGGEVSRAADIWSLGVTLVRCLSQGQQAREGYNPIEQGIAQAIPQPFRQIARECLRPDPKTRCTLADIRNWLQPTSSSPAVAQQPSTSSRVSLRTIVPIAIVILLLTFFVVRWTTHGKPETPAQLGQQQTATPTVSPQPSTSKPESVASPPQHAAPALQSQNAVVERVMPDVSRSARETIQGKIRVGVRATVNPAGEVTSATLASPGPSKYFANKALEAARRWRFTPATDGRPREWMLRFQIGRGSTEVVPTELQTGLH